MPTTDERAHLEYALKEIRGSQARDIPTEGRIGDFNCPLCHSTLLSDLSYDEIEKIKGWTVAQLIAWHDLIKHSGMSQEEALAATSEQPRPGIGQVFNPTVLGLTLNGIFVGIETDGYVHS